MIEILEDSLVFRFPEIHPQATLCLTVAKTLRLPEEDCFFPPPPRMGRFPLFHVDDFMGRVPDSWIERGGVMIPIHENQAARIEMETGYVPEAGAEYPHAVKIGAGKVNVLTGGDWVDGITGRPQDYMVAPAQARVDGFFSRDGSVRQFVAASLGKGLTEEERKKGVARFGGLQVAVFPMKAGVFKNAFPHGVSNGASAVGEAPSDFHPAMGARAGGRTLDALFPDPHGPRSWEGVLRNRVFIHLLDAASWEEISGRPVPFLPPTREDYLSAGLPWVGLSSPKGGLER